MTVLVACLSTGKGSWAHVAKLMSLGLWDKIFLITNSFGKEKFSHDKPFETVVVNFSDEIDKLVSDISNSIDGKILDTEVALNFFSGSGSEHMALLSSLLKMGLGVRLVIPNEKSELGFSEV